MNSGFIVTSHPRFPLVAFYNVLPLFSLTQKWRSPAACARTPPIARRGFPSDFLECVCVVRLIDLFQVPKFQNKNKPHDFIYPMNCVFLENKIGNQENHPFDTEDSCWLPTVVTGIWEWATIWSLEQAFHQSDPKNAFDG